MSKKHTPAKPCTIRVTRYVRDIEDTRTVGRTYRSVREARANILDAGQHMDRLSRATYSVDIVTQAGETIPVRSSIVDLVMEETFWSQAHYSIGDRLSRGEMVAA